MDNYLFVYSENYTPVDYPLHEDAWRIICGTDSKYTMTLCKGVLSKMNVNYIIYKVVTKDKVKGKSNTRTVGELYLHIKDKVEKLKSLDKS